MVRSLFFRFAFPMLLIFAATPVTKGFSAPLPSGYGSEADPISEECIVCHNGSEGYHIKICFVPSILRPCGSHIISADYEILASRKEGLNPPSDLPPEIALFNGILTCVTCHGDDPHLGQPLAMDNSDSRLCRTCHRR